MAAILFFMCGFQCTYSFPRSSHFVSFCLASAIALLGEASFTYQSYSISLYTILLVYSIQPLQLFQTRLVTMDLFLFF